MRIGIFGGSFDPVHIGHLLLAENCRERCRLDRVLFVPAARSPHKQGSVPAEAQARVDMLKLAVGGNEAFEVSTTEVARGGLSYTVDTLTELRQQHPEASLFFLMGADSLEQFKTWRQPEQICQLATLVVVGRPGSQPPALDVLNAVASADALQAMQECAFEAPLIDISSSEIRRRVRAGNSIRYQTPRAVEMYIYQHRLYLED